MSLLAVAALATVAAAQLPKGIVREKDTALVAIDAEVAKLASLTPHIAVNIEGHTAPIRALAFSPDSQRLFTAGMDKVVHVWKLPGADEALPRAIVRERSGWRKSHTIRWEIARGIRGSIYTLAVSPHGDQVAMAGLSARGAQGEIVWADVADGTFKRSDSESHAIAVATLAYSPNGRWMASSDSLGGVQLHDIASGDSQRIHYDGLPTQIRPVAMLGNTHVLIVHAAGSIRARRPDGNIAEVPKFELQRYSIEQQRIVGQLSPTHLEYVSALAGSSDGRLAASADGGRNLYLHRLTGAEPQPIALSKSHVVVSLSFSGDGRLLAVGTQGEPGRETPQLQIWDTAARKLIYARTMPRAVSEVAFSPDGRWVAHTGDESHNVLVVELPGGEAARPRTTVLAGGDRITRVAAIDRAGGFQTLLETSSGETRNFNPAALADRPLGNGPPRVRTMSPDSFAGAWTVDVSLDRTRVQLRQRGVERGMITLDPAWHGLISNPHAWCFVPDENGDAAGIAIGTDTQHGIFIYDLAPSGECNLLRYYRGHNDMVNSLSASRDGRYIVSGSADGTIRYWKLAGLDGRTVPRRWGAELGAVPDVGLQVTKLVDTSPLFHKGVRDGDIIEKILWTERGTDGRPQVFSTKDPGRMYAQLQALPWHAQVSFITRRGDERLPAFNLVGGWNYLLAVYVYADDWIAWHPSGYYTCSPGGERLVGWHVNLEMGQTPKLYPAVRFHKLLFKPDALQTLLERGGLDKPEQQIFQPPPPPLVEIVDPAVRRVTLKKGLITVRARAKSQSNEPITSLRLLINGVEAPQYTKAIERVRLVAHAGGWIEREWTVPIVSGQHTIAVRADAGELYDITPGLIVNYEVEKARRTLHLLVIGVNDYQHDDVPDLSYAVSDGARVENIFTTRAKGIYDDVSVTHVREADATRGNILAAMQDVVERATMNDLVVVFYSGHGLRTDNEEFYFVAYDADQSCIREKGLSGDDLKRFCRELGAKSAKTLLLVDACHSGAMKLDDLTRELGREEYNVAMMASSRGSQVSWEDASFGGGAFTQALHLGLFDGEAETPFAKDGVVDSKELGNYVELVVNIRLLSTIEPSLRKKYPIDKFPQFYTDGAIQQTPVSNFTSLERIQLTRIGE